MPRTNEQSYREIADYLRQQKLPVSVNGLVSANITSRSTIFRLMRPEMFPEMSMYGIVPVSEQKPYFFAYNATVIDKLMNGLDKVAAEKISQANKVVVAAAKQIEETNAMVLSDNERRVVNLFRKHVEANPQVTWDQNFSALGMSVEGYFETLDKLKEPMDGDISKFRTIMISFFVSSFNTSEDEDNVSS